MGLGVQGLNVGAYNFVAVVRHAEGIGVNTLEIWLRTRRGVIMQVGDRVRAPCRA